MVNRTLSNVHDCPRCVRRGRVGVSAAGTNTLTPGPWVSRGALLRGPPRGQPRGTPDSSLLSKRRVRPVLHWPLNTSSRKSYINTCHFCPFKPAAHGRDRTWAWGTELEKGLARGEDRRVSLSYSYRLWHLDLPGHPLLCSLTVVFIPRWGPLIRVSIWHLSRNTVRSNHA